MAKIIQFPVTPAPEKFGLQRARKKIKNFFVSGGNAMLGISQGAGAGLIISDIIENKNPPIDISAFKVEWF